MYHRKLFPRLRFGFRLNDPQLLALPTRGRRIAWQSSQQLVDRMMFLDTG